tara:strand:- start:2302 stop:3450 length:1149 start_codon:yes stop_codon:yes gene_type:complete
MTTLEDSTEQFRQLMIDQCNRIRQQSGSIEWVNYATKPTITIGICSGDGIGPIICHEATRVLDHCLSNAIKNGRIVLKQIPDLTIEYRAKMNQAIPDDVLTNLKQCDVILKGPTTTPQMGDSWPNIESANVAMRRELDLFACVRPIQIPEKNIDWTFFRENTEGAYALGSKGLSIDDLFSVDFKIISTIGSERIIRMAFEYAKKQQKNRVTVVTKSNILKATDGRFSTIAKRIAADYPSIEYDEWYVDIMAAKLIDPARQTDFEVLVMPNLYGDILTDEASQIQGGVGTASSANIGTQYAMFEAVHGSAPRMIENGRAQYANPSSMIKAAAMLMQHIGYTDMANRVHHALDAMPHTHPNCTITGHANGVSGTVFTDHVLGLL